MKSIILLLILLIPLVSALEGDIPSYDLNELFDLSIHLSDSEGNVIGADCKTEIRYENYSFKDEQTNNEIGAGWYNLTYNSSETGFFYCRHNCTRGTDFTSDTCDFEIIPVSEYGALLRVLFFFLIAVSVLVVSYRMKNAIAGFIGSMLWIFMSIFLYAYSDILGFAVSLLGLWFGWYFLAKGWRGDL